MLDIEIRTPNVLQVHYNGIRYLVLRVYYVHAQSTVSALCNGIRYLVLRVYYVTVFVT